MLAVVGAFAASSGEARATPVTLNPTGVNVDVSGASASSLAALGDTGPALASMTLNYGDSTTSINGSVLESVYQNTKTGGLDFTYQIQAGATSTDKVHEIDAFNYTGFSVSLAYTGSGNAPLQANLQPAGDQAQVFFYNSSTDNGVAAGASSAMIVLQTNAQNWNSAGNTIVHDGDALVLGGYSPAVGSSVSAPEPGTLLLTLSGLPCLGFGWLRRRRRT
jgi:hypothetical protein